MGVYQGIISVILTLIVRWTIGEKLMVTKTRTPLWVNMTEDQLRLVVIVFIVIAGVWLTILSYLVLAKMSPKKEKEEEKEEKEPETEEKEEEATETEEK